MNEDSLNVEAETRSQKRERTLGWLVIAAMVLVTPLTFVLPKFAKIERGGLWGAVLLIGMAGWGGLIERLAFPKLRADLGLRIAWGAGGLLAAGGLLCLCSLGTRPVLMVIVLGGVALSVLGAARARRTLGRDIVGWLRLWPVAVFPAALGLLALAGTWYLAGTSGAILNQNDDQAAYMIFPEKIMATGTMLDPFSMRRITALGGHSFLQALTLLGAASPLQISMLDLGISLFIVLALALGAVTRKTTKTQRALLLLPALVLLTMSNIRLNTASEMSGVVFFLALFRTATWKGFKERPAAGGTILALLCAAACTLRQSYLVPVAVFMTVLYLPQVMEASRASGDSRKRLLTEVGRIAGLLFLFLLPWALLSYRSNRTFLFPVVAGNYRAEYGGFTTHATSVERVRFLWMNICHCHPITTLPFFLLAGMLIPWRRTNGALRAMLWASFIGFVTVVYSLPLSDRWNIARYYYGFCVATVLATMLAAFTSSWSNRAGRVRLSVVIPAVLTLLATSSQIQDSHNALHPMYEQFGTRILAASAHPSTLDDHGQSYRKLQAKVPAGAPMLVLLDEAFWLDFKRNRIDIIDLPGAASPPPGMPLDDDDRFVSYLAGQGYRYVAFVRPTASKSLYKRDLWTKQLNSAKEEIWRISAPFYLNMFDRIDSLAKSREKLFDDGEMVALDLAQPAK